MAVCPECGFEFDADPMTETSVLVTEPECTTCGLVHSGFFHLSEFDLCCDGVIISVEAYRHRYGGSS